MPEHAAGREHRELWMRRGAGRGAEDCNILGVGSIDQSIVERRFARGAVAAERRELVGFDQPRVVVFPHAARVGIDDVLQQRHPIAEREQLVDLLFILGEHQSGLAIAQQIGGFLVEHVAIEAEAHRADRMRSDLSRHPVRPVVADNADDVVFAQPQFDHAQREIMHPGLVIVPGEDAPQPEILFAQRDLAAMFLGVETQQFGIGVGLGSAAGVIHHAAVSAAGMSSGSTRVSSSSPR